MRSGIGCEFLLGIVFREYTGLHLIIGGTGEEENCLVGISDLNGRLFDVDRAADGLTFELTFGFDGEIEGLAAHDEAVVFREDLARSAASVAFLYAVILDKRNIGATVQRNFTACVSVFVVCREAHGKHTVGVTDEIFSAVGNAVDLVGGVGGCVVYAKTALVIFHILVESININISERAGPAAALLPMRTAQSGIAHAVFRDLQALGLDPAEYAHAEMRVSEGERPFFPSRPRSVVLTRVIAVVERGRGDGIPKFHFRLICHM